MKDSKFPYLLIMPATLFVAVMLLYPIIMNIGYSFREMGFFSGGSQKFIGLQNYIDVFNNPAFGIAFRNTILFTFASIFIQFLISLPLALLFNQNLPGQSIARGLALVPWMIPHVVAALAWVWMMDGQLGVLNEIMFRLGFIDSYHYWLSDPKFALAGVTLINIWKGIPFNLLILLAGLQSIPEELYEAAKVDGASTLKRLFYVTLPLLRPQISVLFILGTIYTFRNFDLIFVATGGGPVYATETLSTLAYKYSFDFFQMGQGSAVANIMFVVMIFLTLIYARLLEKDTRYE